MALETKQQSGFTLIEMSISIIILGLLVAPLFGLYQRYQEEVKLEVTYDRVEEAMTALQDYKNRFGAYPCPAPLTAPRGNVAYGRAVGCRADAVAPDVADPAITGLTYGQCAGGVCVEETVRPATELSGDERRVIVGAFPFRDMQKEEQESFDGYGRRLLYAVSYGMTDKLNFDAGNGAIAVQDANGANLSSSVGNVPFIVLSHGKTGLGGYDKSGALHQACPSAGQSVDRENCNDGFASGSGEAQSVYVSSYQAHADGAGFFDDYVFYVAKAEEQVWGRVDPSAAGGAGNPEDIRVLSGGDLGIGLSLSESPVADLDVTAGLNEADPLTVNDAIAVYGDAGTGGVIYADRICDSSGANCFEPELLDNSADLQCASGYLAGIENGVAVCTQLALVCPEGETFVGTDPLDGSMVCSNVDQGCRQGSTLDICGSDDYVLANDVSSGWSEAVTDYGACRDATVQCDSGTLVLSGESGHCVDQITETRDCYTRAYTGTYTNSLCQEWVSNTCQCIGGTSSWDSNCPAPQTGRYTNTCVYTVQNNSQWCARTCTDDSATQCACPPVVADPPGHTCIDGNGGTCRLVDGDDCPGNLEGDLQRVQRYNTASCNWEDTGETTGTCTCNPGATQVTTVPMTTCAPCGTSGSPNVYTASIEDTVACTYGAPVLTTAGTCSPRSFRWQDQGRAGTGNPSALNDPILVGSSCSCADFQSPSPSSCFYSLSGGNQERRRCRCQ